MQMKEFNKTSSLKWHLKETHTLFFYLESKKKKYTGQLKEVSTMKEESRDKCGREIKRKIWRNKSSYHGKFQLSKERRTLTNGVPCLKENKGTLEKELNLLNFSLKQNFIEKKCKEKKKRKNNASRLFQVCWKKKTDQKVNKSNARLLSIDQYKV